MGGSLCSSTHLGSLAARTLQVASLYRVISIETVTSQEWPVKGYCCYGEVGYHQVFPRTGCVSVGRAHSHRIPKSTGRHIGLERPLIHSLDDLCLASVSSLA